MSFCPNCGTELQGNPLFCPECGTYLMNVAQGAATQQSEPQPEAYSQPQTEPQPQPQPQQQQYQYYQAPQQTTQQGQYYQPPVQNQQYQQIPTYNTMPQQNGSYQSYAPPVEDKVKIGLAILSFFIPLVGWILFFKKRNKTPKAARVYGIVGLVSFALAVISSIYSDTDTADFDYNTSSIICEADNLNYDTLFI